jgi:hypothetical protein
MAIFHFAVADRSQGAFQEASPMGEANFHFRQAAPRSCDNDKNAGGITLNEGCPGIIIEED